MSTHPTIDPRTLWRSSTADLDSFRVVFPPDLFEPLLEAVQKSLTTDTPVEELTVADLPLGPLSPLVERLGKELSDGSGFRLVSGIPVRSLTVEATERVFWAIGLHLGQPVSQSVMGERLGHVRDVTKTDPDARAYRNRSELTPHTDPADLLAFLCIHPAADGGISRFVSSMSIHERIRDTRPDLLDRLYAGYRYHRLGEQQPGCPDITAHNIPVFSEVDGFVSCRYVRHYIEVAAAEDDTITLEPADIEALNLLETLAADPSMHFEFTLRSGEAVFANNFTVLHARGSFDDRPDQPARHLLRLWLSTDPKRPLTPNIQHYEGEPGIQPIAGRMPSYETDVAIQ